MNRNTPILKLIISVAIAVIVFQSSVFGQRCQDEHDYNWVAGTGDWSVPENWEHNAWNPVLERCVRTPGVPGAEDNADIDNGGTALITGSAKVTDLWLGGVYHPGTVIQTDGDLTISGFNGHLFINRGGRYELHQGDFNSIGVCISISGDGGTFVQTGGNVTIGGYSHEGYFSLYRGGRYELKQGDFNANDISNNGGTVVQTGGNATIHDIIWIDEQGEYELKKGSVAARKVIVGDDGTSGTFVQTGGNLITGDFYLKQGTYKLFGGTVDALSILVGYQFEYESKYSGSASFVMNGGVINGIGRLVVYGSRGSLSGPGTFNIPVVYKSEEIYGTSGNRSVDVNFSRNCLTEGGAYEVKQLTPDDFADGNVPNLLQSSVFEVNFDGSFCGEFEINIPYDRNELEAMGALDMDETNIFILHETGEGKYECLDDTIARCRGFFATAKASTFGKFAVACLPRVILVHGWRPALESRRVATWKTLKGKLQEKGIPYYEFSYLPATGDPKEYAKKLRKEIETRIKNIHERTGCYGKFDIVCHSMGAMVSRWYMEKKGGNAFIRQWIGVAPVNQGAAVADDILVRTLRFLIPGILRRFFPGMKIEDPALEHMRTTSNTVRELNKDGIAHNVIYRVIVGYNGTRRESYCALSGRTFARNAEEPHYLTYQGDGAVAIEQSKLPGSFGIDCINDVDHNSILASTYVSARVLAYLINPNTPSMNNTPPPDPKDDLVLATDNRGILPHGNQKTVTFDVDSSVEKVTVIADWQGSDIDLQIIAPFKQVLNPIEYPVVEYLKESGVIYYVIDAPTLGAWTVNLLPIDVPKEGEPFSLGVFYTSPLSINMTTAEETYNYPPGASPVIIARLMDSNNPITSANVTAQIIQPDMLIDEITLYDDGTHGDFAANDGNYTNFYKLITSGDHIVNVYATGTINGSFFERMDIKTLNAVFSLDFNYDNIIDFSDFTLFATKWLNDDCHVPYWCDGTDLDHSGQVDFIDLGILVEHWLEDTTP